MRSVRSCVLMRRASAGASARAPRARRASPRTRSRRPPRWRSAPRPGNRRRARSRGNARRVLVVAVPPGVRRGLRVALRRVLPLLLAPERREVEVAPRAAERLVAALVDEVRAKDVVAVPHERVGPVPLADAEVHVEVAGDRV